MKPLSIFIFVVAASAAPAPEPLLLPRPLTITMDEGHLRANKMVAPNIKSTLDPKLGSESYTLKVTQTAVEISYGDSRGLRWAFMTLRELARGADGLPLAEIPCCTIVDRPRFAWRGFMLDESRHFTGKAGVKRLLDAMASVKMNVLHWHLTDEPAWRLEIKQYPKLTDIGSTGSYSDPQAPKAFYTQEDVAEIVAYAAERGIDIIPEIDMPGHATAANRAYPQHSGGGSKKNPEFTFNPAKVETEKFLTDILREVRKIFPKAPLIHLGGDEVHYGWEKWPNLPEVKALMATEGLKELKDVEGRFIRRMANHATDVGWPKVGLWDEASRFDLASDRTVLFWWRHEKPESLKEAITKGYPVVLCPRLPCYFDFVQDDSHKSGRRWNGFNRLENVYDFPESLGVNYPKTGNILGIQACLWTETAVTQDRRDFLTFPRLFALAEAAWTAPERKDFQRFKKAVAAETVNIEALGLKPWTGGPEVKK